MVTRLRFLQSPKLEFNGLWLCGQQDWRKGMVALMELVEIASIKVRVYSIEIDRP